jgi:UDP-N-acetylmuramyl pentapeptide phosphotransferase/UDP-N-acetylglucosamine-1-phosphate transferase
MFIWTYDFILLFSAFLFAVTGTGAAYALLRQIGVMDEPNARSNHQQPTPRGGGLGIMFACISFLTVIDAPGVLIWGMLLLAVVSFWDDMRSVSVRWRMGTQLAMAVWVLAFAYDGSVSGGLLPRWVELPLLALAWLWFINLFNFMDGSDGLAASEAAGISLSVLILGVLVALPLHEASYALVVLGASLGFLLWNWHPARVFMGDVGSIPLGFLLGYMLISFAGAGYLAIALILPAYFVADASFTLLRRLLAKQSIFEAHSAHAYQKAIRAGMAHDAVSRHVIGLNIVLLMVASLSTLHPAWWYQAACVLVAYMLAAALMLFFSTGKRKSRAADDGITDAEIVEEVAPPSRAAIGHHQSPESAG